ncbi:hypothetical protein LZC95_18030 [Pendulispora brunnea]|uniref:Uncharacterized protein n=1 Tax=Pendulispora brunnea TaxID=2905690 RepID=A0ABZ2KST8_9BACT
MNVRYGSWLVCGALIACSSASSSVGNDPTPIREGEDPTPRVDAGGDASPATDAGNDCAATPDARPASRVTPSNLPSDICDVPGTDALVVPAGTTMLLDPSGACDALVPQGEGLPSICVRKYASVSVEGTLSLRASAPGSPAMAIVATDGFTLAAGGIIDGSGGGSAQEAPAAPDRRGTGYMGPLSSGGGGAGHVTLGGGTGSCMPDMPNHCSGIAYGPTTGAALVSGAPGASGSDGSYAPAKGGAPGRGGGAVQLVSCGALHLAGSISVSGAPGGKGDNFIEPPHEYPHPSPYEAAAGGGGGGSGGTLVIEAARITTSGASLRAVGGAGGNGGDTWRVTPPYGGAGAAGGAGGTGASPPGEGGAGDSRNYAGGGGGGSVGRIIVNVPADASVPDIASDPPASIGVIATH